MNPGRLMILVFWMAVHLGGWLARQRLYAQMKQFEDLGVELSAFQVRVIVISDLLLVKYWYLCSIAITFLCVFLWSVFGDRNLEMSNEKLE